MCDQCSNETEVELPYLLASTVESSHQVKCLAEVHGNFLSCCVLFFNSGLIPAWEHYFMQSHPHFNLNDNKYSGADLETTEMGVGHITFYEY